MVTTLFGVLALPGGLSDDGSYREQRIRFAIAVTLVVVYFVLFSNAVLWGSEKDVINVQMMDTLMPDRFLPRRAVARGYGGISDYLAPV
jgi:hypothetical protein